ncbi:MAG: hypothetical protein AVO35_00115 [Candidatus Aegiribacteria sp. MLS_C]|nr:MAG: hypothetical protein AVO35_00115 [Candidatus Aegiribacteria sp. MLS_C]
MTIAAALLLAVLQGLTEFLPVSSSGHLALAGLLMDVPRSGISFEIVVHLGTLVAVLAVYRRDIRDLLAGLAKRERESMVLAGMLLLGSLPAALAGLLLQDCIEVLFSDPVAVSAMLMVTGTVLFSTRFIRSGARSVPGPGGSLLVGLAQALAILPGISRSGMTISAGLIAGIDRERAARFSFLLSVPAIAGAAMLKLGDAGTLDIGLTPMLAGFTVSALTGYIALRLLLGFLREGRFSMFSWYCWLAGGAGLVLSLTGT